MPRSGRRGIPSPVGAPAGAYPQSVSQAAQAARPTQPVMTATGQGYGEAGAQAAAQRMVPLPAGAPVAPPTTPPAGPALIPGTMTPQAAVGYTPPSLDLLGPSTRPNEPVTAGIDSGPGPGRTPSTSFNGAALLAAVATATNDPSMRALADIADAQGF